MLNDARVSQFKKVYLAPGFTDLRRGIDGLTAIVRFQFSLDPYDKNTLFLFCTDGRTVPDADAGVADYGQTPDCRSQAAAESPVVCAGC